MRFGLFYEHQLPRPWERDSEERLLRDALEQIEIADRIGIDYLWEVEHHFLEEYSHSSAPEVFLAAASQRTKRIRLGHGIVQLPPSFNHPARVAERVATLDLLSDGRVEFGTGESSSQMELGGFGIARDEKREQWEEALDAITRMFVEEPFAGYDGAHFSMPRRNVVPKPKQKPHPPLWAACSRRETILLAARKGLGALSFSFVEPEDAKEWVDNYYRIVASERCVPAGFRVDPNFAVVVPFMCHGDEATAIERGLDGGHFFGYSLAHYYVFGEHRPARSDVWQEFERHRAEYGFARDIVRAEGEELGVRIMESGLGSMRGAVGTPDQIARLIERYEAAGVDQIILVAQSGRNRHDDVCESLELFGREVVPRFAEEADDIDAARRERLAPAIEAALARREPARIVDDGYVITAQGEPKPAEGYVLASRLRSGQELSPAAAVRRRMQEGLQRLSESALTVAVKGRSDDHIVRTVGSDVGLKLLFKGMERAFVPDKAQGFTGTVQYVLSHDGEQRHWQVRITPDRAIAEPGPADDAAVTLRASVADFVRIAAGELNGVKAAMQGKLQIEGDVQVASRLREMFGGESPY